MLFYDANRQRYIGERVSVDADTFMAAINALVHDGTSVLDAFRLLRDEQLWSPDLDGVEPILNVEDVLAEAEQILHQLRPH